MRRILSLDGGGVRSFFSLEVLQRVESILRDQYRNSNYRLSDHFDLIAGTSAGAIIGTLLSWGLSVAEVKKHYHSCIQAVFTPGPILKRFKHTYTDKEISKILRELFKEFNGKDSTLGSENLKTLLLVVLRNATTGSPWPLCNNPNAKFNAPDLPDCNLKIPLWQIVRASTAAPTYFPCEKIPLGDSTFEFIDGGVSPYNNPSFLAYQFATLPCYEINWSPGSKELFLLSVGVGNKRPTLPKTSHDELYVPDHAKHVIESLMHSSNVQQDLACRTIAQTLYGPKIDSEIGDMIGVNRASQSRLSYTRYDTTLSSPSATPTSSAKTAESNFALDNLQLIEALKHIGAAYAADQVKGSHLI